MGDTITTMTSDRLHVPQPQGPTVYPEAAQRGKIKNGVPATCQNPVPSVGRQGCFLSNLMHMI